jgi:hypothetical protein
MPTYTTKLNLAKPVVGADDDVWGGLLNGNADIIDGLAPLNNPVFTGNPQAPTAAQGDNDTTIATTAFVTNAMGAVPGGAVVASTPPTSNPGALWWDNISGQLYIRYDDGSGPAQWVTATSLAGLANAAAKSDIPPASAVAPLMNGTAAAGTLPAWAPGDHVHPVDTSRASVASVPVASSTNPVMNGTVAVGSGTTWARADHVHASDTSRVAKAGDTMSGTLTLGTVADPLNLSVGAGQSARFMATRPGRQWSCGQISSGSFAIADETAAKAVLTMAAGGTSVGVAGSLTVSTDANITGSMSCSTATVNDGSLSMRKGSANNPAIYYHDGATNRTVIYFDIANGRSQMTDLFSGGALYIAPDASFTYNGNGNATKAGGGPWIAPSDARIKTVEGDYKLGLDEVMKLRPIRYRYKGNDTDTKTLDRLSPDGETLERAGKAAPFPASPHRQVAKDGKLFVGLVAQEVEAAFPGMVTKRAGFVDGEPVADLRDVDSSELIYALVNAVKTLTARIEALEGT